MPDRSALSIGIQSFEFFTRSSRHDYAKSLPCDVELGIAQQYAKQADGHKSFPSSRAATT